MTENPESKSWNQLLEEWYKNSGKSMTQIQEDTGIPKSTFRDYIRGRIKDLDRIAYERLRVLYELTGLDCFRYEGPIIEISEPRMILDTARQGKEGIDRIVENITSHLEGRQKLETGLLKAQLYKPTVQQRADAIMELLDVLSEEVDYFRTASNEEKRVLVERLQSEPESFGYITQILNIIYSGKKVNSWMLMAQPPSKTKRLTRKDK